MSDAEESAESVHPWPYLSEIFACKSKAGNSVKRCPALSKVVTTAALALLSEPDYATFVLLLYQKIRLLDTLLACLVGLPLTAMYLCCI